MTVQKLLTRGSKKIQEIADEAGVATPTLYEWRDKFGMGKDMKKPSKPQSKTVEEKFKLLLEFGSVPEEDQGEYLRKNGLHIENLNEWRRQAEEGLRPHKKSSTDKIELIEEQKKNKKLEKEILRKDKALAEAAALLILKKKADLLWGLEEDE